MPVHAIDEVVFCDLGRVEGVYTQVELATDGHEVLVAWEDIDALIQQLEAGKEDGCTRAGILIGPLRGDE